MKLKKKTLVSAYTLASMTQQVDAISPDGKCRILALRGGGTHGSFEVGVLKAFVEELDPLDMHYDYLSGVSIGAINSAALAMFDFGQEKQAIEFLEELYTSRLPQDFFKFWPSVIFPPLWKSSIVDNTGMRDTVENLFRDIPWKRKVAIQSVDLNTGQVVIFDETVPMEIRNDVIVSSASIPAVFPPVHIDDMALVDGGNFSNISIGDPIARCREEGVADEDIIVDAILCFSGYHTIEKWNLADTVWKNALDYWYRRTSITRYYEYYEDMVRVTRGFPHINFRYTVAPMTDVPSAGLVPIRATQEMIREEIDIGYRDGLRAVLEARNNPHGKQSNHNLTLQRLKSLAMTDADDRPISQI